VEVLCQLAMLKREPNDFISIILAWIQALEAVGEDETKLKWIRHVDEQLSRRWSN
jgi:hypothetical protein